MCGKSYVLIDFPRLNEPVGTRAEEDERGASRAYLVSYAADELINWSYDESRTLSMGGVAYAEFAERQAGRRWLV